MNKNDFLKELESALSQMKKREIEKSLAYYSELIDDMMESGISEEEAIGSLEAIDVIAKRIIEETPEQEISKTGNKVLITVLLIAGSPIWIALISAAFALLVALLAVIFALMISLIAVVFALFITFPLSIISFALTLAANPIYAVMMLGMGLICAALCLFLTLPTVSMVRALGRAIVTLSKKFAAFVKKIFTRKNRINRGGVV